MRLPWLVGFAVASAHGAALRSTPHALPRVHRTAAVMLAPHSASRAAAEAPKEPARSTVSPALVLGLAAAGSACLLATPAVAQAISAPVVAQNSFFQAPPAVSPAIPARRARPP